MYEPAEDTFLLVDALAAEVPSLAAAAPGLVVELGSGSGCVTATLARLLGGAGAAPVYLCLDVNLLAADASRRVTRSNDVGPCHAGARANAL